MTRRAIDLKGKRFGKLTVIGRSEKKSHKGVVWACRCDCGRIEDVVSSSLRSGEKTCCKECFQFPRGVYYDLTGRKFGHLTVVKCSKGYQGLTKCTCVCECGNTIELYGSRLVNKMNRSCGCKSRGNPTTTRHQHRESKTRLYQVWCGMKMRCMNVHHSSYPNYGGRGIKVCDEWVYNYEAFRDWAMANGYDPKAKQGVCTLDRIDNDGPYSPDNCRWVSMKVQSNNKRNNK